MKVRINTEKIHNYCMNKYSKEKKKSQIEISRNSKNKNNCENINTQIFNIVIILFIKLISLSHFVIFKI